MVLITVTGLNVTGFSFVPGSDDPDLVTRPSIFWAIVALALNAMAQTSITTDFLFGTRGTFQGGLSPQLSSPVICAMDACLEFVLIILCLSTKARRGITRLFNLSKPNTAIERTNFSKTPIRRELVIVRAVIFVFAILPPAIKVFGMNGIVGVQMAVAAYLAAPLTRTLSMLMWDDMEKQKQWLFSLRQDREKGVEEQLPIYELPGELPSQPPAPPTPPAYLEDLVKYIRNSFCAMVLDGLMWISITSLHFVIYLIMWSPSMVLVTKERNPIFDTINRVLFVARAISLSISLIWTCGPFLIGGWPYSFRWWPRKSPFILLTIPYFIELHLAYTPFLSEEFHAEGLGVFLVAIGPVVGAALLTSILVELCIHYIARLLTGGKKARRKSVSEKTPDHQTEKTEHEIWDEMIKASWRCIKVIPADLAKIWTSKSTQQRQHNLAENSPPIADSIQISSTEAEAPHDKSPNLAALAPRTSVWQRLATTFQYTITTMVLFVLCSVFQFSVASLSLLGLLDHGDAHAKLFSLVTGHLREQRWWVIFAIFNLVSTIEFLVLAFDGRGTINPAWTSLLG